MLRSEGGVQPRLSSDRDDGATVAALDVHLRGPSVLGRGEAAVAGACPGSARPKAVVRGSRDAEPIRRGAGSALPTGPVLLTLPVPGRLSL